MRNRKQSLFLFIESSLKLDCQTGSGQKRGEADAKGKRSVDRDGVKK